MRISSSRTILVAAALAGAVVAGGAAALWTSRADGRRDAYVSRFTLDEIPFDGRAAQAWIERLCALGPRPTGSAGMARQQQLLAAHFAQLGAEVRWQRFELAHPVTRTPLQGANLVASWHPERRERVLVCAHYDTRPYPDQDPDPRRRDDPFLGANDGASGVAVLCELGRAMPRLDSRYGVDFACFDAEEFVFQRRGGDYFLGSTHFARLYNDQPRDYVYRWAILLDMVGDAELQLYQEANSMRWRDTRPLTESIWRLAQQLGVREFIPRVRHEVRDDHVPLHDIAGIPACDIIDFDYPRPGRISYWHTTADTPDKCSPLSLAKVGWVVREWLERVR